MDFATGKKRAWRVVRLAVGWALALVGFVLLFLPGPGLLFLLPGLTLLSAESRFAISMASATVHGQLASTMIGTSSPPRSRAARISDTVISCTFMCR